MSEYTDEIIVLEHSKDITQLFEKIPYLNRQAIYALFNEITFPVTLVYDKYYVDRVYRDTYYTYFSNKHFEMPRNCQRIAIFKGILEYKDFLNWQSPDEYERLQSAFVGVTVIKPTPIEHSNCTMGRTLLDPNKLNLPECYLRTTIFNVNILGTEFTINAFPFTGQDGEIMTCTETCIWEILEYFGSRYSNYRTVLPNDIMNKLNAISQERIIPSRGLTFLQVSNLLKSFGFEPRLYSRESYEKQYDYLDRKKGLTDIECDGNIGIFRKIFHYYVESAIPFACGIQEAGSDGHSIVCIGHGRPNYNLDSKFIEIMGNLRVIDTVYFFDSYVTIDDNQIPYRIEAFDHFSKSGRMAVQFMAVPLYKHIYLEANGAKEIIDTFIAVYADKIEELLKDMKVLKVSSEPIVTRLFLTASRNFKKFRMRNTDSLQEKIEYSNMQYPKFIWVCEFSTYFTYIRENQVVGEIILDATASEETVLSSIIAVRIGQCIGYRKPWESFEDLIARLEMRNHDISTKYLLYRNNLLKGGLSYNDNQE